MRIHTTHVPALVLIFGFFAGALFVGDVLYDSLKRQGQVVGQNPQTVSNFGPVSGSPSGSPSGSKQENLFSAVNVVPEQFIRITSIESPVQTLLQAELAMLCFCLLLLLVKYWRRGPRRSILLLANLLLFIVLFLLTIAEWQAPGVRNILSIGLMMPGSRADRWFDFSLDLWAERFFEPAFWAVVLGSVWVGLISPLVFGRRLLLLGASLLIVSLILEAFALHPVFPKLIRTISLKQSLSFVHYLCLQGGLLALLYAFRVCGWEQEGANGPVKSRFRCLALGGSMILALGVSAFWMARKIQVNLQPVVGAHYYVWFPENWSQGYVGAKLTPAVKPQLGEYSSVDLKIFSQHLVWAKDAGIDFFIFDWWSERPELGTRIEHLVNNGEFNHFHFALHYETFDLRLPTDSPLHGETTDVVFMTEERILRLKTHWEDLARRFMRHPHYLRFGERPVLFIYATRHMVGAVTQAIRDAWWHVKQTTGVELFLVGDEVYYNVIGLSEAGMIQLLPEYVPDWKRLSVFDAVTGYNPYSAMRLKKIPIERRAEYFLVDVEQLYTKYNNHARNLGLVFIPGIIPGYNDRGVRLNKDHPVIPRELTFNDSMQVSRSLFQESLKRLGKPFLNNTYPMMVITSWNEWNEWTQIEPAFTQREPALDSVEVKQDRSLSSAQYTEGLDHDGYGLTYLNELYQVLYGVPPPLY